MVLIVLVQNINRKDILLELKLIELLRELKILSKLYTISHINCKLNIALNKFMQILIQLLLLSLK